ncbi:P-loop containing nucleoside triphosphate hydrolase protein [Hypoxylon sp. FL1284]|nr:P-loop containing nucleoside triphosphate hydrolase protein [Hypoxylon sp. FL1284]
MDSMIFTEEEIRYYQALLSWEPRDEDDEGAVQEKSRPLEMPAGQFMFLVLGSKSCGKTSILERFCHGTFTVEDRPFDDDDDDKDSGRGYRHKMRVGEQTYIVDALELPSEHLSGGERLEQAVRITEAAILVYDVRSRASFDIAGTLLRRLVRDAAGGNNDENDEYPARPYYGLVLAGSNADCPPGARQVSRAEGGRLAAEHGGRCCAFLETSARTGDNVDEVFARLADQVLGLRWLEYRRADGRLSADGEEEGDGEQIAVDGKAASPVRRLARWTSWARPWLEKRLGERKVSAPY